MDKQDIIRMAREAGIPIEIDWAGRPSTLVVKDGGTYLRGVDDLERFAALVAAAAKAEENEACAQLCENLEMHPDQGDCWDIGTIDCADAIRARGEQK